MRTRPMSSGALTAAPSAVRTGLQSAGMTSRSASIATQASTLRNASTAVGHFSPRKAVTAAHTKSGTMKTFGGSTQREAEHVGIRLRILDAIQGHAPRTAVEGYGRGGG